MPLQGDLLTRRVMEPFKDVLGQVVKAGDFITWASNEHCGGCFLNIGIVDSPDTGKKHAKVHFNYMTRERIATFSPKIRIIPCVAHSNGELAVTKSVVVSAQRNTLILSPESVPEMVREILLREALIDKQVGGKRVETKEDIAI
jgi:hypothetical protein